MQAARKKLKSFREIRDKSGSRFYEFSTSWWALLFFILLVGGCVIWNTFMVPALKFDPYPYNGLRTALALLGAIQTPILLLYSRKSTDYRKSLLEQDYELEKKIFKKIEIIETEMKQDRELYLKEIKRVVFIARKVSGQKKKVKSVENKELKSVEIHKKDVLQNNKSERTENSDSMTA
ncbi:DUF1003 domain-containing protein [Fluviispira multicolorata]|uniref:DUF1003 domain-containing protein n=1 Tax=Fluviispira multicolorata TaxID=2654512 RepID=A0A833N1F2_9BACT|nr:DUF1003 domain-containing protein [Fluviispira multicolorata]KAB8030770.1 DUF1003 domain-containing protein [Fluviispira multicolorata]